MHFKSLSSARKPHIYGSRSTLKILVEPSQLKWKTEINKVASFSKNCI